MPGVPHVVGVDGTREAPGERREDQRKPRRGAAHKAGAGSEHQKRHKLDRGGRQDVPQGGDGARCGGSRGRRARPGRSPIERVCPRARRVHRRKQHLHRHHKRDDAEQGVRERAQHAGAPLASATPRQRQACDEYRQPQILLNKDERRQPRHARTPATLDEGDASERQQRNGQADLVKLSGDRALQPPPEPVGKPHEERAPSAEETLREARDRQHRYGD